MQGVLFTFKRGCIFFNHETNTMRKIGLLFTWFSTCWAFFTPPVSAASIVPDAYVAYKPGGEKCSTINPLRARNIEKISGRKLSLKERIALTVLRLKLNKHFGKHALKKTDSDKGQLAMILGIAGLVALLIPFGALLSLPCAIAALIIGYSARRRDPSNRKAQTGIVLGWVTIGLFVLALLIVIAVLASGSFLWY